MGILGSGPAAGYVERDLRRIRELADDPLESPEALAHVVDNLGYRYDWRDDYRVQSVRASLHGTKITCIDAAILAYGLLELLFGDLKRRLLAIHRRDGKGEECGHCVALYWTADGRIGTFGKSNYAGLGHRAPARIGEAEVAVSYAKAYRAIGFEPLYYGVSALEDIAADVDWRFSQHPINEVSARLQETYEYGFMLAR